MGIRRRMGIRKRMGTQATRIGRRTFIQIGAASIAGAVLAGCERPRRWINLEPYVRPPEEQLAGIATWYASTCRQCPAGCGILVRTMNGRALKIEGNPEHPLNRGKLCARGQAGLQLLYNPDRLSGPVQQEQGSRRFSPLSWDAALNMLYSKLQAAASRVAIWAGSTTSGHLVDVFQRFAQAAGAPAPLFYDLYSALTGRRALREAERKLGGWESVGNEQLPAYDVSQADVVLSFGGHLLGTGLSTVRYGVEYGAFRGQPLGKRGYLVQLEPRMSITGAVADRWLPVRPGSEARVAQALVWIIGSQSLGSPDRAARARALAMETDVGQVAAESGLSVEDLESLARTFAAAERPLAIPGGWVAGQPDGGEATTMVQALNLVAGTAGQPGGADWNPVVQPSSLPSSALVRPFTSPFSDVQDLVARMRAGEVQVLLVHGTDPAFGLPDALGFVDAVQQVPFVVSFSPLIDETALYADLVLPDRTYLESWGYDVVSPSFGVPIVSSQQPVVTPVSDARSTADLLLTVARGIESLSAALPWSDEVALLKDVIASLPAGAFGGSGPDVLWARFLQHGGWWPASSGTSSVTTLASLPGVPIQLAPTTGPSAPLAQEYPYHLYLYLSDLLSDGRGANQPWLQGTPDPMTTVSWQTWVELHPQTAQELGVQEGDVVRLTSAYGELEAPAYLYPAIRPDTVAVPIGQGHTDDGRYARNRGANPMALLGAEADTTGDNLVWASGRVRVARTGRHTALARFGNRVGVTEGFVNEAFPG
jgi:anaerobic selenocysteine-containing dehydrogenase